MIVLPVRTSKAVASSKKVTVVLVMVVLSCRLSDHVNCAKNYSIPFHQTASYGTR